jgi:hypothetical protein
MDVLLTLVNRHDRPACTNASSYCCSLRAQQPVWRRGARLVCSWTASLPLVVFCEIGDHITHRTFRYETRIKQGKKRQRSEKPGVEYFLYFWSRLVELWNPLTVPYCLSCGSSGS